MRTAILGATGLVGQAMLDLLAAESWAEAPPVLLVSARSAGRELSFRGEEVACRESLQAFTGFEHGKGAEQPCGVEFSHVVRLSAMLQLVNTHVTHRWVTAGKSYPM